MAGKAEDVQQRVSGLLQKKEDLERQLQDVEFQIYNLESKYLEETGVSGNVVKGWDSFLTSRKQGQVQLKYRIIKPQDRVFSNSSVTSQPPR